MVVRHIFPAIVSILRIVENELLQTEGKHASKENIQKKRGFTRRRGARGTHEVLVAVTLEGELVDTLGRRGGLRGGVGIRNGASVVRGQDWINRILSHASKRMGGRVGGGETLRGW